ncbi:MULTISPECIES: hypothetical protein [unclassified Pseudomonas]|uniref:hypothetical protein n=1 Tax=unclassified Pseudomonas TaxID=196821 RepID=UPI000C880B31|nr:MULTISPECIES: hypothetical protein [unclassified Pseudomonas]PMX13642.1 hypothetical protein C1Y23_31535 [Pseudomonas sp. GW460-12]PMX31197.1 hypothetical protein C1Y24_25740 [Pseudomonas sp. MPR-R2A4]PMX36675.1 hypothetical protein C1Y26_26205 [Pseudomonas sp. MPR-R2A7]PMX53213.1 hypothetical protein C1Y17_15205 [Pseudomonas sp. MPR-R2A6]PMX93519.1 hypothetical protein C1Y21_03420 [Pseudomonas sp. MPR-R2A3]
MRDEIRLSAIKAWRDLLYQAVNEQDVEDKYFELLTRADEMEYAGLITEEEWRKLVRKAGEFLASTAI